MGSWLFWLCWLPQFVKLLLLVDWLVALEMREPTIELPAAAIADLGCPPRHAASLAWVESFRP